MGGTQPKDSKNLASNRNSWECILRFIGIEQELMGMQSEIHWQGIGTHGNAVLRFIGREIGTHGNAV